MAVTINGTGSLTGITDATGISGAWTNYTPTVGGITAGTASPSGGYVKIGRTVAFAAEIGFTPSTTYTGSIFVSLPFTSNRQYAFQATLYDATYGFYPIWCYGSGNAAELFAMNAAGTYGALEYCNSSKPTTLSGKNGRFYISGVYEATS